MYRITRLFRLPVSLLPCYPKSSVECGNDISIVQEYAVGSCRKDRYPLVTLNDIHTAVTLNFELMLIVAQLVKNFPTFYVIRKLIACSQ